MKIHSFTNHFYQPLANYKQKLHHTNLNHASIYPIECTSDSPPSLAFSEKTKTSLVDKIKKVSNIAIKQTLIFVLTPLVISSRLITGALDLSLGIISASLNILTLRKFDVLEKGSLIGLKDGGKTLPDIFIETLKAINNKDKYDSSRPYQSLTKKILYKTALFDDLSINEKSFAFRKATIFKHLIASSLLQTVDLVAGVALSIFALTLLGKNTKLNTQAFKCLESGGALFLTATKHLSSFTSFNKENEKIESSYKLY